MDRRAPSPPTQREVVFCHQCEHRWYKDEHGLICPRCQGDFVEIDEQHNGPIDLMSASPEAQASDPGEDDIEQLHWLRDDHGRGEPPGHWRARYERTRSQDSVAQQQQGGGGGGWGSFLGNAFRIASDLVQPQPQHGAQNDDQPPRSPNTTTNNNNFTQQSISPDGSTTYTRHMHANGYSFTMTTTRGGGLQPRDPNTAQPFQRQPQDLDTMIQLLQNIGAMSPAQIPRGDGFPMGPGGFMLNPEMGHAHTPFPNLFQLLGVPMAAVHGDAVYSQEGLDRIISQLMEQHETGNAPGPASENAIKSLPQRSITEKDLGESGSAECSICMESVALGDKVTVLPCDHWFHFDCIEAWLSEHDTCPHCRKGIMADVNANAARSPSQAPLNDTLSPEHNRTNVPGAFPFPEQSSSSRRRGTGQGEGVFSRMREAFGGGGGPSSSRPE